MTNHKDAREALGTLLNASKSSQILSLVSDDISEIADLVAAQDAQIALLRASLQETLEIAMRNERGNYHKRATQALTETASDTLTAYESSIRAEERERDRL